MRAFALAAAAGLSLAAIGAAHARVWTDAAGRLTFDAPSGWATTQERGTAATDSFTYVISGTAANECHFIATANPNTATVSAGAVHRQGGDQSRFSNEVWLPLLNGITSVFPNNSAQVQSTSVDTSGFWPIQRAEVQGPERAVHAALQLRPGFDLLTLCMTYDGPDNMAVYDPVIRSVGHPNDAAFRAAVEADPPRTPAPAQ